jgi:uncharacterized protein (TIGR00255 family)
MIQSMTGYGKATCNFRNKKIVVELKSLNSKQLDLSTRIAGIYREKELVLRSEIGQNLGRGKVDFSLYIDNSNGEITTQINKAVLESYYNQISSIAENLSIDLPSNWFEILLRMPDVMKGEAQELEEGEWDAVLNTLKEAIKALEDFRMQEGKSLAAVFKEKITNIEQLLSQVTVYECERIEKIKARLQDNLQALTEKVDYDKNRFEQELIFYIERLDINEEKTRLQQHLNYFRETMEENQAGKKLGFIAQEIGREINTLGSKSNHSEMQKIVVLMKDELEQIKEQVLNVL